MGGPCRSGSRTSRSSTSSAGRQAATRSARSTRSSCTRTCRHRGVVADRPGPVLNDPLIETIAERHGKSPAQVVLRWHIERSSIVFPKSSTPNRLSENFALFDFALERVEHDAVTALDRGEAGRTGPNPDVFAYIPE